MRTAVIISGEARSFDRCWANQYWMVYRKLQEPEFFVSVANDADAIKMDLLHEHFPENRIHIERVEQPTLPEPENVRELMRRGPYQPSAPAQGILRQLWALQRGHEYALEQRDPEEDYVHTVRIRPDLWFHQFEVPAYVSPKGCLTPWWSRWGGVNDRVAFMDSEASGAYFGAFGRLGEMLKAGAPLHPESLMAESLRLGDIVSETTLAAVFTTVRRDGSIVPPDPTVTDIVDYNRAGGR